HFSVEPFAALFALGEVPTAFDRPKLAQAHILRTRDSRLIAIHLSSLEKFWQELTAALGAEWLRDDPRFATRLLRIDNYDALSAELTKITMTADRAVWIERFHNADVPFAPVNRTDEVVEDPQVQHLGLMVPAERPNDGGRQAVR